MSKNKGQSKYWRGQGYSGGKPPSSGYSLPGDLSPSDRKKEYATGKKARDQKK